MTTILCPEGHPFEIPSLPDIGKIAGTGTYVTRGLNDLIQDCPLCGPFERHPDGRVERALKIVGRDQLQEPIAKNRRVMIALEHAGAELEVQDLAARAGLRGDEVRSAIVDLRVYAVEELGNGFAMVKLTQTGHTLARIAIDEAAAKA